MIVSRSNKNCHKTGFFQSTTNVPKLFNLYSFFIFIYLFLKSDMAPPVEEHIGFWGQPTSTLDWCENNYEVIILLII